MSESKITTHMVEMGERMARMETKQDIFIDLMEQHISNHNVLKKELDEVKEDVAKGAASVALIKWLVGIMLAAIGTAASVIKLLK